MHTTMQIPYATQAMTTHAETSVIETGNQCRATDQNTTNEVLDLLAATAYRTNVGCHSCDRERTNRQTNNTRQQHIQTNQ